MLRNHDAADRADATDVEYLNEHLDRLYGYAVISTRNHAEELIREIYVRAMPASARPRPEG
jgi:DNA-directed RNA polymerase specialized sigma24 family protein